MELIFEHQNRTEGGRAPLVGLGLIHRYLSQNPKVRCTFLGDTLHIL